MRGTLVRDERLTNPCIGIGAGQLSAARRASVVSAYLARLCAAHAPMMNRSFTVWMAGVLPAAKPWIRREEMSSKRTKRETKKVNKARIASARTKAMNKERGMESRLIRYTRPDRHNPQRFGNPTTFGYITRRVSCCTYCNEPGLRDSKNIAYCPPNLPLCSECHKRLPEALSAINEKTQREIDQNTNNTAYHGTASLFLPYILEKGLVPCRMGGEVYYSPSASRAETYAKSWAVGMHAGNASDSMGGVIVSFPIFGDDNPRREQRSDFAIPRSVAPTELAVEKRIDLGGLRQDSAEYIGYLKNFVGIVDWESDAYRDGNAFADVLRCATACRDRLEKSVPNSVLRDTIYVPWA